jgi:hypothetical protein
LLLFAFLAFLYIVIMCVDFTFCYLNHRDIKKHSHLYEDNDSVLFAAMCSMFWIFTIWFTTPWILINNYK